MGHRPLRPCRSPRDRRTRLHGTGPPRRRVATNASFGGWTKTCTDPPLCAAIVDRLTYGGNIIETGTEPYRLASTRPGPLPSKTPLPAERRGAHGSSTVVWIGEWCVPCRVQDATRAAARAVSGARRRCRRSYRAAADVADAMATPAAGPSRIRTSHGVVRPSASRFSVRSSPAAARQLTAVCMRWWNTVSCGARAALAMPQPYSTNPS